MEKRVAPNQGKQVQCYMDIKIGPRFAGRMVFEVRATIDWGRDLVGVSGGPPAHTLTHNATPQPLH